MKIDFNYNSDSSTWAGNYVAVDRHEDSGWAGRYLASDHHDDRQKQDVILRFCDAADNKAIAKGIATNSRQLDTIMENDEIIGRQIVIMKRNATTNKPPIPLRARKSEQTVITTTSTSRPFRPATVSSTSSSVNSETFGTTRSPSSRDRPAPTAFRRYSLSGTLTPSKANYYGTYENGIARTPLSENRTDVISIRSHRSAFGNEENNENRPTITIKSSQTLRAGSEPPAQRLSTALDVNHMTRRLNRLERDLKSDKKFSPKSTTTDVGQTDLRPTFTDQHYFRPIELNSRPIIEEKITTYTQVLKSPTVEVSSYRPLTVDEEHDIFGTSSTMSGLRWRANEAKNLLDKHKTLLDRFAPLQLGPEPIVEYEIATKYDEVARRLPSITGTSSTTKSSHHTDYGRRSSLPVFSRVDLVLPHKQVSRPPVSDTRKRVRDVICRVRQDGRYFNY